MIAKMTLKIAHAVKRTLQSQVFWASLLLVPSVLIFALIGWVPVLWFPVMVLVMFGAACLGMELGRLSGRIRFLRERDMARRLVPSLGAFAAIFLPLLFYVVFLEGKIAVEMRHIGLPAQFLWALIVGGFIFLMESKKD